MRAHRTDLRQDPQVMREIETEVHRLDGQVRRALRYAEMLEAAAVARGSERDALVAEMQTLSEEIVKRARRGARQG